MKQIEGSLSISPLYQKLFVGSVIGGWLVEQLVLLRDYLREYINAGTWLFQLSTWLLPVIFFICSWLLARRMYRSRSHVVFLTSLLTVIAMSLYIIVATVEEHWYATYYIKHHPITSDSSLGNQWVVMAVCVVLYGGLLWWLKGKRA